MAESLSGWLDYVESLHSKTIDMGLDRVQAVAVRLDVLEPGRQNVLIAGTNGKGSTATALESLALAAGMTVGTTLSPHVHQFNERVRIDGGNLSDDELCRLFACVDAARGDAALTYFEFATLVALLAFREAAVDLAILEIGLGGRLDAFNIVDADVAVVTSIGLEHQDFLGDDLEQIGREKAGIFRPHQNVVCGDVTSSVIHAAESLDCNLKQLNVDFSVSENSDEWRYRDLSGNDLVVPRGDLAPTNCAMAIAAFDTLGSLHNPQISQALAGATIPGRLERFAFAGRPVVVDVAHNPAAAAFLSRQLDLIFPGQQFVGILGMLEGKDAPGVVGELTGRVKAWCTVSTRGNRYRSGEDLRLSIGDLVPAHSAGSFLEALEMATSFTGTDDAILVLGSFSIVEQARNCLSPCHLKA